MRTCARLITRDNVALSVAVIIQAVHDNEECSILDPTMTTISPQHSYLNENIHNFLDDALYLFI